MIQAQPTIDQFYSNASFATDMMPNDKFANPMWNNSGFDESLMLSKEKEEDGQPPVALTPKVPLVKQFWHANNISRSPPLSSKNE